MLLEIATIVAGFAALAWSADRFVLGAAGTARALGVPTLIIGLTVVGFGTSAPEMLVSGIAAWQGNAGIALGNAVGSNIANGGLILGATALAYPIAVRSSILRRELPLLVVIMAVSYALVLDGVLARYEGFLLLAGLGGLLAWLGYQGRRADGATDAMGIEFEEEIPRDLGLGQSLLWLAVGLIVMLASSRLLVWASVNVAAALGVSDLVIGLTVVALGTSLPELAACIASARKGEHDIALGNIIGSNMFNLLGVLGIAGAIAPVRAEPAALTRDYPVMTVLTLALFVLGRGWRGPGHINRTEGAFLILAYVLYQVYLGYSELG